MYRGQMGSLRYNSMSLLEAFEIDMINLYCKGIGVLYWIRS